ncbi:MAG: DUF4363 family protein [Clostridia bacterium]|nr:DUF4363 family protein [Clostridia bacterium]
MKFKLTVFIVVTLFLIAVCVGENIYIDRTFDEFSDRIEKLQAQETYDLDDIIETEKWWLKKVEVLELTMSIQLLNDVTYTYGELIGAVEKEDYQSASGYLERLKLYASALCDMYKVKINNVL